MLQRPPLALGDGGVEHGLQLVGGNVEPVLERLDPVRQRPASGDQRLDLRDYRVIGR